MQLRERRNVHCRERDVARTGRKDSDSHLDAHRRRQRRRGLRDPATEAEILDHPEFVESEVFGTPGEGDELL